MHICFTTYYYTMSCTMLLYVMRCMCACFDVCVGMLSCVMYDACYVQARMIKAAPSSITSHRSRSYDAPYEREHSYKVRGHTPRERYPVSAPFINPVMYVLYICTHMYLLSRLSYSHIQHTIIHSHLYIYIMYIIMTMHIYIYTQLHLHNV